MSSTTMRPSLPRPLVVVEAPCRPRPEPMAEALADAHRGGWRIVRGWAAPLGTERLVCTGRVRTSDDARRSLLAAISGAGLIVHVCGDREIVDRFVDELRSLGHVEHLVTGRPEGEVAAAPHPVQPP